MLLLGLLINRYRLSIVDTMCLRKYLSHQILEVVRLRVGPRIQNCWSFLRIGDRIASTQAKNLLVHATILIILLRRTWTPEISVCSDGTPLGPRCHQLEFNQQKWGKNTERAWVFSIDIPSVGVRTFSETSKWGYMLRDVDRPRFALRFLLIQTTGS